MIFRSARAAILVLISAVLVSAAPANIAGQWQFTVELSVGTGRPLVTLKQEGEQITGTYEGRYGKSNLEGTVKENQVQFTVTMVAEGTTFSGTFTGTYETDRMGGDVEYEGAGDGRWAAIRVPAKP
jgi:hypothetical protein